MSHRDQIAENPSVDATIRQCFALIAHDRTEREFRKRFADQRKCNWSVMNTYRELVVGGILAEKGLGPEHEPDLGGKTPDWLVRHGDQFAIVEVLTSYADNGTFEQLEAKQAAWWNDEGNLTRCEASVREKCGKYCTKCHDRNWAFVVAICLEFSSFLEFEEIASTLTAADGVFREYPTLSGVALYTYLNSEHRWRLIPNPVAIRPIDSVLDPTTAEYELVLATHGDGNVERTRQTP